MSTGVAPVTLARAAAAAATASPDVVRLDGGLVGELATYGGGSRVVGVRAEVGPRPRLEVRAVVRSGRPLAEIGDDLRRRVADRLEHRYPGLAPVVDIHISDVEAAAEETG
ncbi:MAG: hypothetical protein ACRDZ9_06940 [Acidimicrobiales bacterium]